MDDGAATPSFWDLGGAAVPCCPATAPPTPAAQRAVPVLVLNVLANSAGERPLRAPPRAVSPQGPPASHHVLFLAGPQPQRSLPRARHMWEKLRHGAGSVGPLVSNEYWSNGLPSVAADSGWSARPHATGSGVFPVRTAPPPPPPHTPRWSAEQRRVGSIGFSRLRRGGDRRLRLAQAGGPVAAARRGIRWPTGPTRSVRRGCFLPRTSAGSWLTTSADT